MGLFWLTSPERRVCHGGQTWQQEGEAQGRSRRLAGYVTFTLSKQAEPEQDVGIGCRPKDPPPSDSLPPWQPSQTLPPSGDQGFKCFPSDHRTKVRGHGSKGTQPGDDSRSVVDMVELGQACPDTWLVQRAQMSHESLITPSKGSHCIT